MGRILAIDYGRKRVGLAVTDEMQLIATALTTVPAAGIIPYLQSYLAQNTVDLFVVGEPRDLFNRPSDAEQYIGPFLKLLSRTFPDIPVKRVDERFTSLLAARAIRDAGARKKQRQDQGLIDTVSATIILQTYLYMLD